jgi:hypothetical protein
VTVLAEEHGSLGVRRNTGLGFAIVAAVVVIAVAFTVFAALKRHDVSLSVRTDEPTATYRVRTSQPTDHYANVWETQFDKRYREFIKNWNHVLLYYSHGKKVPLGRTPYFLALDDSLKTLKHLPDSGSESLNADVAVMVSNIQAFVNIYKNSFYSAAEKANLTVTGIMPLRIRLAPPRRKSSLHSKSIGTSTQSNSRGIHEQRRRRVAMNVATGVSTTPSIVQYSERTVIWSELLNLRSKKIVVNPWTYSSWSAVET